MTHVAPNVIELSNYRTPSLASKMSPMEITPSQGIEGDPIYAAIERHEQAAAIFGRATSARARFPDMRMNDEQERQLRFLEEAEEAAWGPCEQAGVDLIFTVPTTPRGIFAAIRYIQIHLHNDGEFMPRNIEGHCPNTAWIEAFLDMITVAIAAITQQAEAI